MRILLGLFLLSLTLSYYMDPTMSGYSPYLVSTGGKYSQRADGASAVFNNPANLIFYSDSGRLFSSNLYEDVNIINFSLSKQVSTNIFLGVGYASLFIDNIYSTNLDSIGKVQVGAPVKYKNNIYAFSIAVLDKKVGHGITVKVIDGVIDSNTAKGLDLSYGVCYLLSEDTIVNVFVDNILSYTNPVKWTTGYTENLIPSITLASSYKGKFVELSGGVTVAQLTSRQEEYYNISATWKAYSRNGVDLEANVGVYTDTASPQATYALGTKVKYQGIVFSYALAPCALANKDFVHMFSAGFDI